MPAYFHEGLREISKQNLTSLLYFFAQHILDVLLSLPRKFSIQHFDPAIKHTLKIIPPWRLQSQMAVDGGIRHLVNDTLRLGIGNMLPIFNIVFGLSKTQKINLLAALPQTNHPFSKRQSSMNVLFPVYKFQPFEHLISDHQKCIYPKHPLAFC